jgi:choline dehydrogenase
MAKRNPLRYRHVAGLRQKKWLMGTETFDYVIVGSGPAGSVLADRLTEDGKATVCVLEAGPPDRHPTLLVPGGFIKAIHNPRLTWQYQTEPGPRTGGRPIAATQGRTLGGSGSLNGLVYNRGQRLDYDAWAQRGNAGWGYEDVLPYFKRGERRIGAADDRYRGRDGALPVSDIDWIHPICEAFIDGVAGLGVPRNPDHNGPDQTGVGYYQRIIEHTRRASPARVYLHPARRRGVLDVRSQACVTGVIIEGCRALGVRYAKGGRGGAMHEVRARREVILSAGTLNTPRLLQLSGVGPGELLQGLGIPVLHALAGVGENLQDHYAIRIVARVRGADTINDRARGLSLAREIARWVLRRPSILGLSPSLVHVFCSSIEGLESPDLQFVFSPASYKAAQAGMLDNFPGMTCGVWQHRPESTGFVRALSTDPYAAPRIQPNYLAAENDRHVLLAGMRLMRRFLATPELAPYYAGEELPGAAVESDDELLAYAYAHGASSYHFIGSCRMGPKSDAGAVVDGQLRLHGLDSLRVVDASIMPAVTSGNTMAPTLMIAEKAADMIRGSSSS